jgi:hypothetical protein
LATALCFSGWLIFSAILHVTGMKKILTRSVSEEELRFNFVLANASG